MRTCRIEGCERQHQRHLFCCRPHWFALSKPLRDDIWRAYTTRGVLSAEYEQAAENAEAYLEDRDPRDMSEALG